MVDELTSNKSTLQLAVTPPPIAAPPFLGFGAEWDSANYRAAGITESDFDLIRRRVEWMRLPVARLMMQINWCRRPDGSFDFETDAMHDLYRHLDECEALGTTVFLTDWGCMPEWLRVPGIADVADPLYAEAIGTYLEHLMNAKGYSCLRYFIMVNEPNSEVQDFNLWHRGLKQVAVQLRHRGLEGRIILTGPDEVNAPDYRWHGWAVDQASDLLCAYDVHRYPSDGEIRTGYTEVVLRPAWQYARDNDPQSALKPCIIGELGLGEAAQHPHGNPRVDEFEYGLYMSDLAVQAASAGTSAVLAWMLDDNSHHNFFWGMWTSKAEGLRLRPWFYPWSLLCRLFTPGCVVHPLDTGSPDVRVLIARTETGWAACVVNQSEVEFAVTLDLSEPALALQVATYLFSEGFAPTDAEGFSVPMDCSNLERATLSLRCPPRSVIFQQAHLLKYTFESS